MNQIVQPWFCAPNGGTNASDGGIKRKMGKLKILIAENNPVLLQQLADRVSRDHQMQLVGLVDNGRDACEIIQKEEPNVIVFDMLLPYYDGFALLDKMKRKNDDNEKQRFIMTTPLSNDEIARESYRRGADYIVMKPYDVDMMANKIKSVWKAMDSENISENVPHNIEAVISEKLNQLGIPASLKGYRYLNTAIREVLKDESVLEGVTKILYPEVAKHHNSTPQRVEKAIRHAIEVAWSRNGDSKLKERFRYSMSVGKQRPTNSEFIAVLSQNIKLSV